MKPSIMIAAVKKMIETSLLMKSIFPTEFPIFRYLKINRETKHKRDIIEPEEFR